MIPAKQVLRLRDWLIDHSADLEQLVTLNGLVDIAVGRDYFVIRVIHESGRNERIGEQSVPSGALTDITPPYAHRTRLRP
jgi:hypothetical protein